MRLELVKAHSGSHARTHTNTPCLSPCGAWRDSSLVPHKSIICRWTSRIGVCNILKMFKMKKGRAAKDGAGLFMDCGVILLANERFLQDCC